MFIFFIVLDKLSFFNNNKLSFANTILLGADSILNESIVHDAPADS